MNKTFHKTTTATTVAIPATPAEPTANVSGEGDPAAQENLVAGSPVPGPIDLALADTGNAVDIDHFHESHVNAVRQGKGLLTELAAGTAALCQIRSIVGDRFYDFARTRLGLAEIRVRFIDAEGKWLGGDDGYDASDLIEPLKG